VIVERKIFLVCTPVAVLDGGRFGDVEVKATRYLVGDVPESAIAGSVHASLAPTLPVAPFGLEPTDTSTF